MRELLATLLAVIALASSAYAAQCSTNIAPAARSFSTNFPVPENPISENGAFVTSTTPGVDWSGLRLGGCGCKPVAPVAVTAPGYASPPNIANRNTGDALAVLSGSWGADQSAFIVVANTPPSSGPQEVEIHLRTDPATGRGYEITWAFSSSYIIIATWNGGGGIGEGVAYYILIHADGPQYAISPGDTLSASIRGNVITMYRNGIQVIQYTDTNNYFPTGNPGFGFNEGRAGSYGISSFSATSP
jgi:hypothetical protein